MNYAKIYETVVTLADGKRLDLSEEDERFLDLVTEMRRAYEEASLHDRFGVLESYDFGEIIESFYSSKRVEETDNEDF